MLFSFTVDAAAAAAAAAAVVVVVSCQLRELFARCLVSRFLALLALVQSLRGSFESILASTTNLSAPTGKTT